MGNNDKREPQATTPNNNPTSIERKDAQASEKATAEKAKQSDRKDAAPATGTPAKS